VESNYPGASQILDFNHAKDKLVILTKYQFKDEAKGKLWLENRYRYLMNDQVEEVISKEKSMRSKDEAYSQAKQTMINYFIDHAEKMIYKPYREER
jgi:hypothetical protein